MFEGLDRSGKSTQSKMLERYLKEEMELKVKSIVFPSKYMEKLLCILEIFSMKNERENLNHT